MASYYFLMSSLPMLKSDSAPPLSYEKFLSLCNGAVSDSEYAMLENLSIDSANGPLVSEWAEFYSGLKEELTAQRNKKAGLNVSSLTDAGVDVKKAVAAAVNDENPLNAEKTLLSLQFEKLDSLIGLHSFDAHSLFGYALKLKLLERNALFVQKAGKAEFSRLVKGLEEQIQGIN